MFGGIMHILITGGAGFIGSNLAEYHLAKGDHVHVVDDLSTGSIENVSRMGERTDLRFDHADIVTWVGLDRAVAWADRIYNMAAVVGMFRVLNEPVEVTRVNVLGCERVLEAMVRAGHRPLLVIPSSSSVYGVAHYEELREDIPLQVSPEAPLLNYILSKLTNEVQGCAYAQKHQLPVVTARLFNTIGPHQSGQYGFVVPRFVQQALSGQPMTVFGDGTQTRSFCDVRDTVRMLDALANTPSAQGRVVNVGNNQEITIQDLALLIRQRADSRSVLEYVPYAKAYGRSFEQIPQRRPTLDRLIELTGYRHQWTLESTVDDLIEHYRCDARYNLRPAPGLRSAAAT